MGGEIPGDLAHGVGRYASARRGQLGRIGIQRVESAHGVDRIEPSVVAGQVLGGDDLCDAQRERAFMSGIHVDPAIRVGPGERHVRLDLDQPAAVGLLAELAVGGAVVHR